MVSVELDDELEGRVRGMAERRQQTIPSIVREAVRQYVDREQAKGSFQQEALDSWAEYRASGQHLTGDEVRAWLRTWGTDEEAAMPACHD